MNPIISPLCFYLMGVGTSAIYFFGIVGGLLVVTGIIAFVIGGMEYTDYNKEKGLKILKWAKKYTIIGILSCLLAIFIPTKETCYQMIAATVVTPNNIEVVGETATNIVDYIIESVDALIEKEEEDKVSH